MLIYRSWEETKNATAEEARECSGRDTRRTETQEPDIPLHAYLMQ